MSSERMQRIEGLVDGFGALRVLVVGDLLLDEYRDGDVDRVSPEAPVPIVRVRSRRSLLGGAGNVARGIVSLGARSRLVGVVGEDPEGRTLRALLDEIGVPGDGLVAAPGRPTSHKLRVVARGQQMLRLDREEDAPIPLELGDAVRDAVRRGIEGCDVVVLEDYDKGVFDEGLARWIIGLARERGVLVVADPKRDLGRWRGASLVKPNREEAIRFVAGSVGDVSARRSLLEKLRFELGGGEVVVTRGAEGMTGLDAEGRVFEAPTRALEVFDVQGAGDTAIAALALVRAAGGSLRDACAVANAAAAVAVEKVGTAAVDAAELLGRLPEILALDVEEGP